MLRALLIALLVATCSALPRPDPGRPVSHALENPAATTLGRRAAGPAGLSGFRLVASGREALGQVLAMIGAAERTLDLQYYAWRDDPTGRRVLAHLLAAAERGVRVRVLIDDLEAPADDAILVLLNSHPNLELRLFNPFPWRETRRLNLLFDLDRLTHRMHNKAIIADNAVALTGGRNIGDQYATVADDAPNYRDLDLLAAGPVVRELSDTFDAFWNSRWSIRPSAFADPPAAGTVSAPAVEPAQSADALFRDLVWAPARVLADRPDKPLTERSRVLEGMAGTLAGEVEREVLIETAYLIPGRQEVAGMCALVERGLRVRILTNSLASVDSVAAGAAYMRWRKPLLACGVELYEFRPDPALAADLPWLPEGGVISLHSKAMVFDGRTVFVGSYNLDHRSRDLNTELAVIVDSPELARRLAAFIHRGMLPENSWKLELRGDDLVWPGGGIEPGAGFWRKATAALLSVLPEEQL